MSLGFQRTTNTNSIPLWEGLNKDIQLAQGGFALNSTGLALGSVIPAGTPLIFDEAARTASIAGGGTLQANATNVATQYRLLKNSTVKIGDYLAATVGGAAYAITAIDTTNAAYDLATVGTTLGVALTAGTGLFISTATGAGAGAFPTGVNGLLYDEKVIDYSVKSVTAVIRGTCYLRRLPSYTVGLAAQTGLKNIIFSNSK